MKAPLTEELFINKWLADYHNTSLQEIKDKNPDWESKEDPSGWFYKTYAVTNDQHDEWYEWAIGIIMKYYRVGKKRAKYNFTFPYLDVSPQIKDL